MAHVSTICQLQPEDRITVSPRQTTAGGLYINFALACSVMLSPEQADDLFAQLAAFQTTDPKVVRLHRKPPTPTPAAALAKLFDGSAELVPTASINGADRPMGDGFPCDSERTS